MSDLKYPGSTDVTGAEMGEQNAKTENVETAKKAGVELPTMALQIWSFKTTDSTEKVRDFYKSKLANAHIDEADSGTWTLDEVLDDTAIHNIALNYSPPNAKKAPQSVIDNYGAPVEDVDIFLTKLSDGGTFISMQEVVLLQE